MVNFEGIDPNKWIEFIKKGIWLTIKEPVIFVNNLPLWIRILMLIIILLFTVAVAIAVYKKRESWKHVFTG